MKKIPNPFDWYPRDFWYWPDHDEKLLQVIHQVHDLDQVLPLIPNKRVCIQAGGACGVWPAYLSGFFEFVVCNEPDFDNRECLIKNIVFYNNIDPREEALSDQVTTFRHRVDVGEEKNCGATWFEDCGEFGHDAVGELIDHHILAGWPSRIDFICLDIEGMEHDALLGAKETIERCNPVIMVEEKPLPHLKPGEHLKARQFLESIGYKEVLKVNRDVVFKR